MPEIRRRGSPPYSNGLFIQSTFNIPKVNYLNVKSWLDYKTEFAELAPALQGATLELRFGEGAEDWSLYGVSDNIQKRFMELSAQAGKALVDIHLKDHETGSRIAPEIRWFRFLRERSSPNDVKPLLFDNEGVALFEWSKNDVAQLSANLCIDLQRISPIPQSPYWLINKYKQDPIGTSIITVCFTLLTIILLRLMD